MNAISLDFERAFPTGTTVMGIDEAGRGPLAGPVFTAAVSVPLDTAADLLAGPWSAINDSKKLSEKKREALFPIIQEKALAFAVAWVDEKEIDATDILSARMKAMQLAIDALAVKPDFALIDGNRDHGRSAAITTPHRCLVKGDSLSMSVAAASVLAKVSRDREMERYDALYPEYGYATHKGYPTKAHREICRRLGPSPIQRRTFSY